MGIQTTVYDPKNATFTLGTIEAEGFNENGIEYVRSTEQISYKAGMNGDIMVIVNHDDTGLFRINLQPASPTNDAFSTLYAATRLGKLALLPAMLKDGNGRTLISSLNAYVVDLPPELKFGKEPGDNVWSILALPADVDSFVGGAGPGGVIGAAIAAIGGALGL